MSYRLDSWTLRVNSMRQLTERLPPRLLKQVAETTGGTYYPAESAGELDTARQSPSRPPVARSRRAMTIVVRPKTSAAVLEMTSAGLRSARP